jgi:hypothetical protein
MAPSFGKSGQVGSSSSRDPTFLLRRFDRRDLALIIAVGLATRSARPPYLSPGHVSPVVRIAPQAAIAAKPSEMIAL